VAATSFNVVLAMVDTTCMTCKGSFLQFSVA
jgi:hypothetical protein